MHTLSEFEPKLTVTLNSRFAKDGLTVSWLICTRLRDDAHTGALVHVRGIFVHYHHVSLPGRSGSTSYLWPAAMGAFLQRNFLKTIFYQHLHSLID